MAKPLSNDLRERLIRYVSSGQSRRNAAKVFGIGTSLAIRYVAQHQETGSVAPKPMGGDRRSKLKAHRDYILRRIGDTPDLTLAELAAELATMGVSIHVSNLSRFLTSEGLTFKKKVHRGSPGKAARILRKK